MAVGLADALDAVERALPEPFPNQVWQPVSDGARRHAALFLKGAEPL